MLLMFDGLKGKKSKDELIRRVNSNCNFRNHCVFVYFYFC